uniref:Nuclear receptor domain-containing protein n=1 Tax=Panagrolaimus sp. PS1159 TaxID=55785 RepID=A0AC35FQZ5_9BILA
MAEQCLICGNLTKSLNFQLNACRACAAFYRRSLETFQLYRCQNNTGNCDVTKKVIGKPICRYCRYQKCLKVGMKSTKDKNDSNSDNYLTENFLTIETENSNSADLTKTDFVKLFKNVDQIFQSQKFPTFIYNPTENYTKTFSLLLEKYLNEKLPKKELIHFTKVDPNLATKLMEKYVLKCAELINNFQPFAALPFSDKVSSNA